MIYAANFKTNHTRSGTKRYLEELQQKISGRNTADRIFVFPPFTALDNYEGDYTLGVQNCYPVRKGAFTGEIGLEQLEEFGIGTILIGHSERRQLLHETQEIVAEKFAFFQQENFEIVYCIGEPLEIREQGDSAVVEYLLAQFDGIDTTYGKLIIAYEPIWAIGTGRSATVGEIASTHKALRQSVSKPILYGGSVNPSNIAQIVSIDNVDGVLVGSASLSVDSFYALITAE